MRFAGPRGSWMPSRHGRPSFMPANVDVAAALNHEVAKTPTAQDGGAAIDGVAFADAAEMNGHPFARQKHRTRRVIDLNRAIVDERQSPPHVAHIGDDIVLVVIELPEAGERAERDVEFSAGPLAHLPRRLQHLAHLRANRHRPHARVAIDARDVAVGDPRAHQLFQPRELGEDLVERGCRGGRVGGPRRERERGAHREARG